MSHLLSKGDLEKLRKLAKTAQIFSTHPVLLNGQSVEAGFDRGLRAIFVSHILWPKLDENAQRRLALHELLWFIDDRDADGSVSSQLPNISLIDSDILPLKAMHKKIYLSFSFKQGAKVPTLDEMVATEWWQCAFTNIGQGGYNPFLKFKRYGEGLKIYQSFLYGLIEPLPDVKPHMPMIGAQSQVLERTPQGIVMKGTSYDFSSGDFDFRETWRMDLAGNLVGELSAQASSDNKTKRVKSQAFPDFEIVSLMECKK